MTDLTPRQTQILRLIQNTIAENGMPPTRAEIARTLGFESWADYNAADKMDMVALDLAMDRMQSARAMIENAEVVKK